MSLLIENRSFEDGGIQLALSSTGVMVDSIQSRDEGKLAKLAEDLLEKNNFEAASDICSILIQISPENKAYHVNLGISLESQGRLGEAIDAFEMAHALDATWDEPMIRLGLFFLEIEDYSISIHWLKKALEVNPGSGPAISAYLRAVDKHCSAKEFNLATAEITLAARARSDAVANIVVAEYFAARGNLDRAIAAFDDARQFLGYLSDDDERVAIRQMEFRGENFGIEQALKMAELHLQLHPDDASVYLAKGFFEERSGDARAAIESFEVAYALNDGSARVAAKLGSALFTARLDAEAEPVLRSACDLNHDDPMPITLLGGLLFRNHRHAEARRLLEDAIPRFPGAIAMLAQAGTVLTSCGLQEEGYALLKRAEGLAPSDPAILRSLVTQYPYHPLSDGEGTLATAVAAATTLPLPATVPPVGASGKPKLRLGLLSGSFRTHPVSWLTIAAFEALNKDEFEIVCFSNSPLEPDWMTHRWRALSSRFEVVPSLCDTDLTAAMREAALDILIDLAGWGDSGRPDVIAARVAPVQIKWVGAQAQSTGIIAVDWYLTDRWETPAGYEKFYSERLLRLDDGYVCYSPPQYAPEVAPLPYERNGYITFGCFNNLAKITPSVIGSWARIMQRVPDSRLVLKTHQFSEEENRSRIYEAFSGFGIPHSRIELRGRSPHKEFLAEYADIDIALDPFPYSGGLTTVEALWLGVPTAAIAGESFASRHSASHMSNAGFPEWVFDCPQDAEDFLAGTAENMAKNGALAELRRELRSTVQRSPLVNSDKFAKSLSKALRFAWSTACGENSIESRFNGDIFSDVIPLRLVSKIRERIGSTTGLFPVSPPSQHARSALRDDGVFAEIVGDNYMPWAMEPESLSLLKRIAEHRRPKIILELGSGVSTAVLGSKVKEWGGRLVSLEQDADWARKTMSWVRQVGADSIVLHAPIKKVRYGTFGGEMGEVGFYDVDACGLDAELQGQKVDMLIIDGPSAGGVKGEPLARFPSLSVLGKFLAPGCVVSLDDALRDAELWIAERWISHSNVKEIGLSPIGKGVFLAEFKQPI